MNRIWLGSLTREVTTTDTHKSFQLETCLCHFQYLVLSVDQDFGQNLCVYLLFLFLFLSYLDIFCNHQLLVISSLAVTNTRLPVVSCSFQTPQIFLAVCVNFGNLYIQQIYQQLVAYPFLNIGINPRICWLLGYFCQLIHPVDLPIGALYLLLFWQSGQ